jgi:hypothetical protein
VDVRALCGAGLGSALAATALFAACRTAEPLPPPFASASAVPPPVASATPPPDAAVDATSPAEELAAKVAAARGCQSPTSRIVNSPPAGGVVFNNAMHRKDAGNLDRLQGVVDAVGAHANSFRCCFDVWAAQNPGVVGKLLLEIELAADGALSAARVNAERSTVAEAVTVACVLEVARSAAYPASPAGRATLVEVPFVVAGAEAAGGNP